MNRYVTWGIIICIHFLFVLSMSAQENPKIYPIPFASNNNSIELTVVNNSRTSVSGVKVLAKDAPSWLRYIQSEQELTTIKPNRQAIATFIFAVDKTAPVNTTYTIEFNVLTPSGEQWKKQIDIIVTPPERFELFQNYPNPFNPATTISYQLPNDARVTLKIYNVLGQEVLTLIDNERTAGYHEEMWDAGSVASGMYIYQVSTIDQQGIRVLERKKLMVMK